MAHFNVGDKVKPVKTIKFIDGTSHSPSESYMVNEITKYYFNACNKDYVKVGSIRDRVTKP